MNRLLASISVCDLSAEVVERSQFELSGDVVIGTCVRTYASGPRICGATNCLARLGAKSSSRWLHLLSQ